MDKILIVDDNADFLGLVDKFLKSEFIVDTASNASDALSLVRDESYKAVILDVSLPDYTGYYLGKQIKKEFPDIPLAFLTNYDGEVTRENAEELDAKFWLKSNIVYSPKKLSADIHNLYE